uniref:Uncharacterized protein n=1 Tax=Arundo donax TaxID=35708 RepID=A0A0A9F8M1_ARUDO
MIPGPTRASKCLAREPRTPMIRRCDLRALACSEVS